MSAQQLDYWKRRAYAAEHRLVFEEEAAEHAREWGRNAFDAERRLSDRCTYLYGLAVKHGATDDELRKAWPS